MTLFIDPSGMCCRANMECSNGMVCSNGMLCSNGLQCSNGKKWGLCSSPWKNLSQRLDASSRAGHLSQNGLSQNGFHHVTFRMVGQQRWL